jgi:hypothetical protein
MESRLLAKYDVQHFSLSKDSSKSIRSQQDCSPSTVPAGSLAKAASLGANTVRGPLPERVSTSPHAVTAAAVK